MSPEPLVKSHREPIRSVRRRGVVPMEAITRLLSSRLFLRMASRTASSSSLPLRCFRSLSARYFSFSSLGRPLSPSV